ncbi:MAG: hypothetical protein Q4A07_00475 [Coriobacteriales bacterium]|nr:hypothetical protein [Coriobacteriales bacterium]
MDASKFMQLFDSSDRVESDFETSKEAIRRALDKDDAPFYYDISGDGTSYYRSGIRNGAGYSSCILTLQPDGFATVRATSVAVPEEHWNAMRKLCGSWNVRFKLRGLKVQDGKLVFESAPFDPVSGRFDANEACGLALSTVHHYASSVLALEADTEPWDLLDLYEEDYDDSGDDDDDGGTSVPSLEEVRDLLQSMRKTPQRHTA